MESESLPPGESYQVFLNLLSIVSLQEFSFELLLYILLVIILLFLSAIVSGSEIAFFSFGPAEEEILKLSESKKDKAILKILERKRILLSTILISNNFINVGIIILSNFIISQVFNFGNNFLELIFNAVIVTAFLVFFGEVMPKILASKNNFQFARFTLPFIHFFSFIFFPFAIILAKFGNFLDSKIERKKESINLDEIEKAIDLGVDDNTQERDKSLLKGIVHFGNTTVKQIMKPRVDVFSISEDESFEEVLKLIKESGFSRIPIYKENIDSIVGVLYIKDLLPYLNKPKNFKWQSLLREPSYTSETKKIDDLLREIQTSKQHLYIVADEYGGTLGILTLEDILEEVVGEINDEFDDELDNDITKNNDGTYLFDGKTSIHDMCKSIEVESSTFEDEKGGADTLAGLILEKLGKMPQEGDTININQFEFKIVELEKNRIKKIFLKINEIQ